MKKIITLLLLLVLIPCTISISQNNFQIQAFSETVEEVFTYDIENDCCIITGYTGNESIIEIPEQIGNQTVIGISTNAFVNNKEIISAVLPTTEIKLKCTHLHLLVIRTQNSGHMYIVEINT